MPLSRPWPPAEPFPAPSRSRATPPKPKKLKITKDKKACDKRPKFDSSLVVKDGKLANVIVYIAEVKGGKALEKKAVTLDQNGCEYQPHILAVAAGADVTILNPDKVLHNIHTYSKVNKPMNRAQPKFKKKLKVKFAKPEIMEVKCDVHGWMSGWIFVGGNPYYSVTGEDGAFSLTDVPPASTRFRSGTRSSVRRPRKWRSRTGGPSI